MTLDVTSKLAIMEPAPHTFESVIMTVKEAETEMNSRKRLGGGKPKQYYNKLASKVHQHRNAFDVFPSTNEYVSIFCGSIKTLIKASVNYIKISEGLSRALDEISDLVDFAKRQVEGIPTEYTRTALARLYKEIFLYLKDCTEWYNQKSRMRALKSFNEDFYDRFADRMKCIKDVAQGVHQETTIGGIRSL
ncbi:phytanoyl- dioxygenase family protein [Rutstroemia sp. NJR-2017a BBW]|nr:phytanoyl- dioxygenase family protein [Rutstroemia sp. NJR-2017a BBW]